MPAQDKFHLDLNKFDDAIKQRNITVQSYELYGRSAGLNDIGLLGCGLKQNLLALLWKHFTAYENFAIETPILTPKTVLDTSGHPKKFCDCIIKDVKTKTPYRADHPLDAFFEKKTAKTTDAAESERLLEAHISINNMTQADVAATLETFSVEATVTDNDMTEPMPFNLMVQTDVGTNRDLRAILRQETVRGMFLAFNRCLELNGGNGPFIVTQIGSAFLNEISPSNGMVLSGMSPLRRLSTLSRKTGMIVRTVRRWRISSCRCRVVCRGTSNPES